MLLKRNIEPKKVLDKVDTLYMLIKPEKDYIRKVFQVYNDGGFDVVEQILIRLDNVLDNPIKIDINTEEWSVTLDGKIGVLFVNEFSCKTFMDELFFTLENVLDIPEEERSTSSKKVILDLEKELEYMGEEYGDEFNDFEIIQK